MKNVKAENNTKNIDTVLKLLLVNNFFNPNIPNCIGFSSGVTRFGSFMKNVIKNEINITIPDKKNGNARFLG